MDRRYGCRTSLLEVSYTIGRHTSASGIKSRQRVAYRSNSKGDKKMLYYLIKNTFRRGD